MTNLELNLLIGQHILKERESTNEILKLINLAAERQLDLELGYSSLLDWLVKGHHYSESAARRRIAAARLLKTLPQISNKLEAGTLNLSGVAKAHAIFRAQEKISGVIDASLKAQVIEKIENKSAVETERVLFEIFPETASTVSQEHTTTLSDSSSRLAITLSKEDIENLDRAKELLSHALPEAGYAEVIAYLTRDFLKRRDPLLKKSAAVVAHRGVSASVKRLVIQKAQGACEFCDPLSGHRCGSRYQTEIDHVRPRALGGDDSLENLRLLCRRHNLLAAQKNLGLSQANQWRGNVTSARSNH
jgi:hypothetical protein